MVYSLLTEAWAGILSFFDKITSKGPGNLFFSPTGFYSAQFQEMALPYWEKFTEENKERVGSVSKRKIS